MEALVRIRASKAIINVLYSIGSPLNFVIVGLGNVIAAVNCW